jgi:hypothetical protein
MARATLKCLALVICLLLLAGDCGQDEDTLGQWTPLAFVEGTAVYTSVTEEEICVMTAVNQALGTARVSARIKGVFFVTDPHQELPRICDHTATFSCQQTCVTQWKDYPRAVGIPEKYPCQGYGGLSWEAEGKSIVMVTRIPPRESFEFLLELYVHELGHAVAGFDVNRNANSEWVHPEAMGVWEQETIDRARTLMQELDVCPG